MMRGSLGDVLLIMALREDLAPQAAVRSAASCRELHGLLQQICRENLQRRRAAVKDHPWYICSKQILRIQVSTFKDPIKAPSEHGWFVHPHRPPEWLNDPYWVARAKVEVHADVQDAAALGRVCSYIAQVCPAPAELVFRKSNQLTDDMLLTCARQARALHMDCECGISDACVQQLACCQYLAAWECVNITRAGLECMPQLMHVIYDYNGHRHPATHVWLTSMKAQGLMGGCSFGLDAPESPPGVGPPPSSSRKTGTSARRSSFA